ncbi:MAG: AraC family transcriptional regulator [Prevotella sp.]|nr:AraC family transcriptional regulator [Prevotella sp.]
MEQENINSITIQSVKDVCECSFIDNDLVVFDEIADIPLPNEPRRMKCILLALCLHGKGQYSMDTEERMVKANDLIIINEEQVIDNYMLSSDISGIAIMLSPHFFSEIVKDIHDLSSLFLFSRTHPVFSLTQDTCDTIKSYFNLIKEKMETKDHYFRKDVVRNLMSAMIYDLSHVIYQTQQQRNQKESRADAIFAEFIRLVERNFRHERRVSWYSERMSITPKYLSEMVKRASRRTPNEWIDNYVTLEIRVLLKNTTKSIKEITKELHFPNQSFFGKFFKEHVGMSPSEYRKS